MPESTVVKNMRDGKLEVISGADSYEIAYEEGVMTLNVPGATVANYLDRGQFTDPPSLRFDQDQPMTGSFTFRFRDAGDAAYVTASEHITKTGAVANWGSTLGVGAEVKTVTLRWTINGTNHQDLSNHVFELPYSWLTGSYADGSPITGTINFTSYKLYPTVT